MILFIVSAVISRLELSHDATAFPSVCKETILTEILKRTQFFHVEVCYFMQNICNPGVVLKPLFSKSSRQPVRHEYIKTHITALIYRVYTIDFLYLLP